jgi:hypothetical protein
VDLLRLVFFDGQHFGKFFMALEADVFVKGHRLVRLVVEGSVSLDATIFLKAALRFPLLAKASPLFVLRNRSTQSPEM